MRDIVDQFNRKREEIDELFQNIEFQMKEIEIFEK